MRLQWIQTLVKGHPGVLKITKKKVVRLYTTSGGSALVSLLGGGVKGKGKGGEEPPQA